MHLGILIAQSIYVLSGEVMLRKVDCEMQRERDRSLRLWEEEKQEEGVRAGQSFGRG
jgi:hypothetical protein